MGTVFYAKWIFQSFGTTRRESFPNSPFPPDSARKQPHPSPKPAAWKSCDPTDTLPPPPAVAEATRGACRPTGRRRSWRCGSRSSSSSPSTASEVRFPGSSPPLSRISVNFPPHSWLTAGLRCILFVVQF
jgi:hypothetical protein